jgi:competence protein ComEA
LVDPDKSLGSKGLSDGWRSRHQVRSPIPEGNSTGREGPEESSVTREERNVLVFVALGILLGSVPRDEPGSGAEPAPAEPADSAAASATVEVDLFPIDLNRAGPELLEQLPGIGPAKARAIVALREERGAFRSVDELADVSGIGPKTVERLRDLVTVGAPGEVPGDSRERGSLVGSTRDAAPGESNPHLRAAGSRAQAAEVVR